MSMDRDRDGRLVGYLLGTASRAEQEELEEQYFSDPALHEELEAVADDLIHAYLVGGLSPEERRRFEEHFLASPRQRERLEFIRTVIARVGPSGGAAGPARSAAHLFSRPFFLAAAALIIVTLSLVWLRPKPESSRTAGGPSIAATPSPVATPAARTRPVAPVVPAVVRLAGAATDANVVVPKNAAAVRFEVAVAAASASYDAVLRTVEGAELWRVKDLEQENDGAPLVFSIPAAVLAAGRYVLEVEAEGMRGAPPVPPIRKCTLRVTRQP